MGYRVGVDIGGTFTDLALLDEGTGALHWHKVLTTPRAPAEGALQGLRALCARVGGRMEDITTLIHATTLVTNAIIERKGARTALLTTEGFRDILEMGKEQRYDIYDLFLRYPEPLVPRRWRIGIPERMTRDGTVRVPLDVEAVRRAVRALVAEGVESLAIVFLHAYRNPAHERLAAAVVREEAPGLSLSLSSEVCPEIGEFERTSTTVCNAYVQPLVDRYLRHLEEALAAEGFRGRLLMMLSNGTLATPETARRLPIRLLESGPAAGALAVGHIGGRAGRRDLVGLDMGGTTAKVCLVWDGRPHVTTQMEVARVHRFTPGSGLTVRTPVVDMIEIGAGGGSIARADTMGLLRVGPHSAGADPGPACYGRGGTDATVTDACVVLGYFDPGAFLGGTMPLNPAAARVAVERVGRSLGLGLVRAAWGIFAVVCESMAQAARLYLIERGQDPRRFALVALGGAGPAVAVRVARLLGMRQVLVPPASGVASAVGLLAAPVGFELGRSLAGELHRLDWPAVEQALREMEAEGRTLVLAAWPREGSVHVERRAGIRYLGQFHDLEIPVPNPLPSDAAECLRVAFDDAYARQYGMALQGYPVQALNWRVLVVGPAPELDLAAAVRARKRAAATCKGRRPIYLPPDADAPGGEGRFAEVPVYDRYELAPGSTITGPAVIEEAEATTLLWSGDLLTVDPHYNLVIEPAIDAPVGDAGAGPLGAAASVASDDAARERKGGSA
ncbi:MAG: hydantoinase/oxoprolinase family protein [bacterium]